MYAPGYGRASQGPGSIIVDHEGAPCTDSRYHRYCRGRWRGVLSRGFGPDGTRRRYKVSGRTKQDVVEALKKKSEELDAGLSTSRSYTVEAAARDWLEYGLPGRSERTRELYRDALAPFLAKIGKRPLRDLTAGEVGAGLRSLAGNLSSRSLQIAHNSLRRAIRYAEANGMVGRNVAGLIDTPKGRTGRRRRAFTLAQAAVLIVTARSRPVLELHGGLKDPPRSASLMHAYIVVSLMAGVRPQGGPGDRVGEGRGPRRQSSVGRGAARGPGWGRHQDPDVAPRTAAGADGRWGAAGLAGRPGG